MYEQLFKHQEEVFKVIANQKRLEIIQLLTHGELSVNQMVNMLGISQSNVSQHLGLLRHVNIVQTRKEGKTIFYSLTDARIAEACSLIRQFLVSQSRIENTDILEQDSVALYPLIHDPVCGMRMSASEVAEQYVHEGTIYYFCAGGCRQQFVDSPSSYVTKPIKQGV